MSNRSNSPSAIQIKWTPRFQEHFRRYNGIDEFVIKKTSELVKKATSDPETWHFELEKLKDDSFTGVSAFRFKVTSGDRLIIVVDGDTLILADIGDHDVMDEYSKMPRRARDEDLMNCLLYTSPSPRDLSTSRMPSSA